MEEKKENKGLVYVFTGDGKGKTSTAFWTGVRMALRGKRVAAVQFYKEARWPTAEQKVQRLFAGKSGRSSKTSRKGSFDVFLLGKGFYKLPTDHASKGEHKEAAGAGMDLAKNILMVSNSLKTRPGLVNLQGRALQIKPVDLLILDEVNNAVADELTELTELTELIEGRGKTHLVLTGRNAHKEIIAAADLVTEMKKIKHPFDRGVKAIKGLDF